MRKHFVFPLFIAASLGFSACAEAQLEESSREANAAINTKVERLEYDAPPSAWRDVDPENLIRIETDYGTIYAELYPEIAPNHVERIKTLANQRFYDFLTFHRVIEGFMNQTGDPKGDGTGASELPDIEAEFTFRRGSDMPVNILASRLRDPRQSRSDKVQVGFYKGLPVATQPLSQAILTKDGKVAANGLHCKGVTSMARSGVNTGNSQFFLMRGPAQHLDGQYSVWGNTVYGHEFLTKFKIGTKGQDRGFVPDKMNSLRVVANLPEDEQVKMQVLKTDHPAFDQYLNGLKNDKGEYPDICDIQIPSRIAP